MRTEVTGSVVYVDRSVTADYNGRIVPSRRWEAWREGVDDFRSLKLLQKLCEKAEAKKLDVTKKRKILATEVEKVLNLKSPDAIEHARVEIMTAAAALDARLQGKSLEKLLAP